MDVKQKILDNVKQQATLQGRIDILQDDVNRHVRDMQRLGGKMELLQEILAEESGMDINQFMQQDQAFRDAVDRVTKEGRALAEGTAQAPAAPPPQTEDGKPTLRPVMPMPEAKAQEAQKEPGTTAHSGNKKVDPQPVEDPVPEVVRHRNPPKIVVTDEPPTPDDPDDDD